METLLLQIWDAIVVVGLTMKLTQIYTQNGASRAGVRCSS